MNSPRSINRRTVVLLRFRTPNKLTRHGEARMEDEDAAMTNELPEILPSSLDVLAQSCGINLASLSKRILVELEITRELLGESLPSVANSNVINLFER